MYQHVIILEVYSCCNFIIFPGFVVASSKILLWKQHKLCSYDGLVFNCF